MQAGTEIGTEEASLETQIDILRGSHRFPWLLHNMPKVTLALVNGAAAGAGMGLALSCDLRIASDQARFGTAYARVGYGGDFGTTWQLTRIVGEAKAKELFFLPDLIPADEALRIGMVNRVVPLGNLLETAKELVATIAAKAPLAVGMALEALRASDLPQHEGLRYEAALFGQTCATADFQEGVAAFLEGRKAAFKGK